MDISTLLPELKAALAPELIAKLNERLGEEKAAHEAKIEALRKEFGDSIADNPAYKAQGKRLDELQALINAPGNAHTDKGESKSMAQRLWDSDQRKSFVARAKHEGGFAFACKDLFEGSPVFEHKTTIDSGAVGNATAGILVGERLPGIAFAGVRKIRVRDLIPSRPLVMNAMDYVKENAFTNNAYPQTESSAKLESALTFTIAQAPVRTIAHWIPASAQVLDDWSDLRAAIDFKLLVGLKDEEDFELMRGDGTGNHVSGLLTGASVFNITPTAGDSQLDTLSEALQQLEISNRYATGIVMHPADWRAITRVKTNVNGANTGSYLLGSPSQNTDPMLWGLPVAITVAINQGHYLVGDFVRGALIGDRMEARIDVSNQHQDFFTKNLVAIRAEERIAMAIYRSDYFVAGTF